MLSSELQELAARIYPSDAIQVALPPELGFKLHAHTHHLLPLSARGAPVYVETDKIPKELDPEIAKHLEAALRAKDVDVDGIDEVVGVPDAANRFAKALADRIGKKLVVLQKEEVVKEWERLDEVKRKWSHSGHPIFFKGPKSLIVENIISSGDSVMMTAATRIIRGHRVTDVCSPFCWRGGAARRLQRLPFRMDITALFPLPDFFEFFAEKKVGQNPMMAYNLVEDFSRYLRRVLP